MKKRNSTILLILTALVLSLAGREEASAAPLQQGGNLLTNAGFEQPYVDGTAEGWSSWYMESEKTDDECLSGYHFRPKWNMETKGSNVNGGVASQYIGNNWDTWGGGVYQTVDVTPGTTYRFTFFSKGRTTSEEAPEPSEFGINMNIRAGIDPDGTEEWYGGDVVWGPASSPHDNWQQFSVEATATGDKLTVFTSADLGVAGANQCRQFLDTWYDNAELVAVAQASPTAPPPPPATAAPANTAVPQATATAAAEPTAAPPPTSESPDTDDEAPESPAGPVTSGATICVNAFHDLNANGSHEENEEYMADVTFTVASQDAIIGSVIADGGEDAKCFFNLEPGRYQVAQQVPANLQMTSEANVAVEATEGATVAVAFGSRVRGEAIAEAVPGDSPGDSAAEQEQDAPLAPTSGAMICVNAFHDENANAAIDPNEGYMEGVKLSVAAVGGAPVGEVMSAGNETPQCFDNLQPGEYEVRQQVAGPLEMTTADNATLSIAEGQSLQVAFGSRLQMSGTTTDNGQTADEAQNEAGTQEAQEAGQSPFPWVGLAVIVVVVLLVGVLLFFVLRR